MDDMLFVKVIFIFLMWLILGGLSQQNRHLLILDGHGSHVILNNRTNIWNKAIYDYLSIPHFPHSTTFGCQLF
jgi:hypothetical protein